MKEDSKEIIEAAKLISRFMSDSKEPYNDTGDFVTYNSIDSEADYFDYRNMKYHTSWDWLMPVVEKIEFLWNPYNDNCIYTEHEFSEFSITGSYVSITTWGYKDNVQLGVDIRHDIKNGENYQGKKVEAVWKTVIEFITWYNTYNQ